MSVLLFRKAYVISSILSSGIKQETTEGNISKCAFMVNMTNNCVAGITTVLLLHATKYIKPYSFAVIPFTLYFLILKANRPTSGLTFTKLCTLTRLSAKGITFCFVSFKFVAEGWGVGGLWSLPLFAHIQAPGNNRLFTTTLYFTTV